MLSLKQSESILKSFLYGFFVFLITFFIMAYLLMVSYNYSIPQMNDQYKQIQYITALWFTLFIAIIGLYVKCNCGVSFSALKN